VLAKAFFIPYQGSRCERRPNQAAFAAS